MKNINLASLICLMLCLCIYGCSEKEVPNISDQLFYDNGTRIEAAVDTKASPETTADTEAPETTDSVTEPSDILSDTPDVPITIPSYEELPEAADETEPEETTEHEADTEAVTEPDDTEYVPDEDNNTATVETVPDIIDLSGILAVDYPASGQFVSHQSEKLRLLVNYECTMLPAGAVQIDLEVGLESYDINCGARTDTGKISVNGEIYTFSTDALVHEGRSKKVFPFTWHTYQNESGKTSCEIDVSWLYNGSYAGEKIDTLTASAVFKWD